MKQQKQQFGVAFSHHHHRRCIALSPTQWTLCPLSRSRRLRQLPHFYTRSTVTPLHHRHSTARKHVHAVHHSCSGDEEMNGDAPLDEAVGDSHNATVYIPPMVTTTNTCTCPLNSRSLQAKGDEHRNCRLSIDDDAQTATSPLVRGAEPRLLMGTVNSNTVPLEVDLPPFDAHFAEYSRTCAGDSRGNSAASYEDSEMGGNREGSQSGGHRGQRTCLSGDEANKSSEASGHAADAFHSNGTKADPKSAPKPSCHVPSKPKGGHANAAPPLLTLSSASSYWPARSPLRAAQPLCW